MKKEELSDLLNRVGAKGECPVCGTNDWYSSGGEGETSPYVPSIMTDGKRAGMYVLLLICSNCAYIRQHSIHFLKKRAAALDGENDEYGH